LTTVLFLSFFLLLRFRGEEGEEEKKWKRDWTSLESSLGTKRDRLAKRDRPFASFCTWRDRITLDRDEIAITWSSRFSRCERPAARNFRVRRNRGWLAE